MPKEASRLELRESMQEEKRFPHTLPGLFRGLAVLQLRMSTLVIQYPLITSLKKAATKLKISSEMSWYVSTGYIFKTRNVEG
jgi:hypothetical protein